MDKSVEVTLSTKCISHLDRLVEMEGFGESREEIIRRFVWNEINRLISAGQLQSDAQHRG